MSECSNQVEAAPENKYMLTDPQRQEIPDDQAQLAAELRAEWEATI